MWTLPHDAHFLCSAGREADSSSYSERPTRSHHACAGARRRRSTGSGGVFQCHKSARDTKGSPKPAGGVSCSSERGRIVCELCVSVSEGVSVCVCVCECK